MKYFIFITTFIVSLQAPVFSAFQSGPWDAGSAGMGGLRSVPEGSAAGALSNPAVTAWVERPEITSFYGNLFGMNGLSQGGFGAAVPLGLMGAAVGWDRFGSLEYQEQRVHASVGVKLGSKSAIGAGLTGYRLKIEGFGSASSAGFNIGWMSRLSERWTAGFSAANINRAAMGPGREPLPSGFSAGARFKLASSLAVSGETERMDGEPALFKTGMEWSAMRGIVLRAGVKNLNAQWSAGFGLNNASARVDYAYEHHPALAGTHRFSVGFRFGSVARRVADVPVARKAAAPTVLIDLETATEQDFRRVKGVGESMARAIVEYRSAHGLKGVEDLLKVPGMRRNAFNALRQCVIIKKQDSQP